MRLLGTGIEFHLAAAANNQDLLLNRPAIAERQQRNGRYGALASGRATYCADGRARSPLFLQGSRKRANGNHSGHPALEILDNMRRTED